jgi:hypothetical protein
VHVIALTTLGLENMFSECSGMVGGHGFQMSEWETAFNKCFKWLSGESARTQARGS